MEHKTVEIPPDYMRALRRPRRMTVHAYGLTHPGHMEWTQDQRLLVSEFGRGRVVDITEPGDYRDSRGFAWGLQCPAGIVTNYQGGRILVADSAASRVVDITAGGDAKDSPSVFGEVPAPYGLLVVGDRLLVTFTETTDNGLAEVVEGRSFSRDAAAVRGFPNGVSQHPYVLAGSAGCGHWTALGFGDRILLGETTYGTIFEVSTVSRFDTDQTPVFCRGLNKPVGMIFDEGSELLYVAESGSGTIKALPRDGFKDARYLPAAISGFNEPRCIRFSADGSAAFVCDMSSCCVWRVDF